MEQRVIDFDNLSEHKTAFDGAEIAYCCLGTTRGKAGKDGFVKVDYDYVVNSAKILKEAGCKDYHLLSSQGANANSYFLYTEIKGKAEEALKALEFDRLSIYRPSVLLVDREENRFGERLARGFLGTFDRSRNFSIKIEDVAKVMALNSLSNERIPVETLSNADILEKAKTFNQK